MSAEIQVSVRLFGAFRELSDEGELSLRIARPEVTEIRAALFTALSRSRPKGRPLSEADLRALVAQSALADERQVLRPGDTVVEGARLAILPPVCGG